MVVSLNSYFGILSCILKYSAAAESYNELGRRGFTGGFGLLVLMEVNFVAPFNSWCTCHLHQTETCFVTPGVAG